MTFSVNFIYFRISFQNGVNSKEIEDWLQSENEKNIDHELDIEVDQSI